MFSLTEQAKIDDYHAQVEAMKVATQQPGWLLKAAGMEGGLGELSLLQPLFSVCRTS